MVYLTLMDMRAAITMSKRLFETPGLVSSAIDFGLDTETSNLLKAKKFLDPKANSIFENDRCKIVSVGGNDGAIGLVSKLNGALYYYVEYQSMTSKLVGGSVTQVELWKHPASGDYYPNITEFIFFDVLLKRFSAIMSDTLQTREGMNFWVRMITIAKQRQLHIQFADFRGPKISSYDQKNFPAVDAWLRTLDAWGTDDAHEDRRLIIRR